MNVHVSVACDSKSEAGQRLTSLLVEVPYALVPYILRCRTLTRSMQTPHRLSAERALYIAERGSLTAPWEAAVEAYHRLKATEATENLNILLTPFQRVTMLLTATSWSSLTLANEEDKQWSLVRELSEAVRSAIRASEPLVVPQGGWHMPLLLPSDLQTHSPAVLRQVSAVRCDALEYLGHGQEMDDTEVRMRYKELAACQHPRALEHVAAPAPGKHSNFLGWKSLRESLEDTPADKRVR